MSQVPHVVPYQGSKRKLAPYILATVQRRPQRLYEPFAGSAAVTLYAARRGLARTYVIGEALAPLADIWRLVIEQPEQLADNYEALWRKKNGLHDPYNGVRLEFNRSKDPAMFLYLMARCVKAAVRFNSEGFFNQSADNRRGGMHPDTMRKNILAASSLLGGKTTVVCADYSQLLDQATPDDLVYMDPPWQGTSTNRDRRYAHALDLEKLIKQLHLLNLRGIPYLLSFDGRCGSKAYGQALPEDLELTQLDLHAGRSSQATLVGREDDTVESLYVSPAIARHTTTAALKNATHISLAAAQASLEFV